MIGALDGAEADGIQRADDLTALNAATGQPHRTAQVVQGGRLAEDGARSGQGAKGSVGKARSRSRASITREESNTVSAHVHSG
jgi:hypothetical protein